MRGLWGLWPCLGVSGRLAGAQSCCIPTRAARGLGAWRVTPEEAVSAKLHAQILHEPGCEQLIADTMEAFGAYRVYGILTRRQGLASSLRGLLI